MKFFSLFGLIFASLLFSTAVWSQSASVDTDANPININTASEEELSAALKNVGIEKAAAIVRHRSAHGRFKSVDDLINVSGIGPVTVEMNRARMTVQGAGPKNQPTMPNRSEEKSDVAKHEGRE